MAEFGRRIGGGSVPGAGSRERGLGTEIAAGKSSGMGTAGIAGELRQPLGVGGIAADSLSIYFQRFGLMFVLSLIPAVLALLIAGAMPRGSAADAAAAGWPLFLAWLGRFLAWTLSNALIVLAAFDTRIGRPVRIGEYVRRALANLPTIIVLSIAIALMVGIPAVLLGFVVAALAAAISGGAAGVAIVIIVIIPCILYVWAAFSPFVPAIVIEGAGFRALGRAWWLTAGYRWPVIGALLVLFIIAAVFQTVGSLLGGLAAAIEATWLPILVSLATGAIAGGIMAVGAAMIYARLRRIKEGLDIESLADVFS
jgi:hypothetical protein